MHELKIKILHPLVKEHPPFQATKESIGLDCIAAIDSPVCFHPGQCKLIPLGFACEPPEGFHIELLLRSSIPKTKFAIPNGLGLIDPDYRGELHLWLHNISEEQQVLRPASRVCQLVLRKSYFMTVKTVVSLSKTDRGTGGLGSTGR